MKTKQQENSNTENTRTPGTERNSAMLIHGLPSWGNLFDVNVAKSLHGELVQGRLQGVLVQNM